MFSSNYKKIIIARFILLALPSSSILITSVFLPRKLTITGNLLSLPFNDSVNEQLVGSLLLETVPLVRLRTIAEFVECSITIYNVSNDQS